MADASRPARGPLFSPGFWLHHAALEWRSRLEDNLQELELTPTQFITLSTAGWLAHDGVAPSQQQVADMSGSDRMMASRLLRALEYRGLVRRHPDPSDARTVRVEPTAEGRALIRRGITIAVATDEEMFGDDADVLRNLLQGLAGHRVPARSDPTDE